MTLSLIRILIYFCRGRPCGGPRAGTSPAPTIKSQNHSLRRLVARLGDLRDPFRRPFDRDLLGDRAGAGVVDHDLADAGGAERAQQLVEALAAMAERRRIGAVAEGDDAETESREIGPVALEGGEKTLRVIRHVALAIGRAADQ